MRKIVLMISLATLVACGFFIVKNYTKKNNKQIAIVTPVEQVVTNGEENEETGQKERMAQEFLMTVDPALGYVPKERLLVAEETAARLARISRTLDFDALTWVERGPNNLAGRSRAVLIDKNDATGNTLFVGSVSGGLWRTTNFKAATPTWSQIASVSANLAITALAQHPGTPNTMYAGTGEGYGNSDAVRGLGIYKSTNGGITWSLLPSTNTANFYFIQKLLVYTNGDLYAAAGSVFCNAGGLVRSVNGGDSWTRIFGTFPTGGTLCAQASDFGAYDIEMALNGDLYATIEDYSGVVDNFDNSADTTRGKIFRSPAGATVGNVGTWTNITPAPPSAAGSFWQRIEIAPSAVNTNTIYAIMQGTDEGVGGMRVSLDAGTNWTDITNTSNWCDQGASTNRDFSRQQAWYDLAIAVKPDDDQTVFVGGVDVMKTANGGISWTQNTQWASGCTGLPQIHADIHGIFHFPGTPNEFIVVNDGGIYYTSNNGLSYTNKSAGYRSIQYYSTAVHPASASNYMLAGSQDNGTHKFSTGGLGNATTATGGDGGFCFIDQTDPTFQVTSFTNANYRISRDGGTSFPVVANFSSGGRFINPTDYDDTKHILYAGYTAGNLLRINDIRTGGISSFSISFGAGVSRQVSAVKVDPVISNRVWVAFSGVNIAPRLYYADGADGAAPTIVLLTLPTGTGTGQIANGGYISCVDVDPTNSNHLLMTLSNYGATSVYESSDLGVTWTALDNNSTTPATANLPDVPVRWAMFLPDGFGFTGRESAVSGIMLATEMGVWTTTAPTSGVTTVWTQSSGVPNVRVDMLEYRSADNLVVAATHGRGLFTTSLETILPVNLLSFDGRIDNATALLEWTTSAEQNSRDFEIEKSTDGVHYSRIGTVAAAGTSSSEKKYSFRDLKLSAANYYRLKMNDKDGRNKLTQVVLLRYNEGKQGVRLVNSPFNSYLQLKFSKPGSQAKIQLLSAGGMLVAEKTINNPWGIVRWDLPIQVSKGAYIVRTSIDGELFVSKTVKQ